MDQAGQLSNYLQDLARAASRRGGARFSRFLDPGEAALARVAAKKMDVGVSFFGGYEGAERVIAAFGDEAAEVQYPLACVEARWSRHASAPAHRDLMGAEMALGLERGCFGDILVGEQRALLYVAADIAAYVTANFDQAGRTPLVLEALEELPLQVPRPQGKPARETVSSMRLDAVTAAAWNLSRATAQGAIARELVKLNHIVNSHVDARVETGDLISLRGYGRARILSQRETKKGRIALEMLLFGNN